MAWSVFVRRQIKGQIPWDHRMATLTRGDWGNPFYYVMAPGVMNKPLAREEAEEARASDPQITQITQMAEQRRTSTPATPHR